MKLILVGKMPEECNVVYPCLMHCTDKAGSIVVLFNSKQKGTVVYSTREFNKLGEYCESWMFENFKKLDSTITLSN